MTAFQIRNQRFETSPPGAGLYLVATPIGNLGDITLRALEVLAGCDLIACEDTRVTAKLLRHYAITTKTFSYHEHNAESAGNKILELLKDGKSVALVSDAGTPVISDPGYRLVDAALEQNLIVYPLPGPTAPITALIGSGLPNETFLFGGFLPTKQGARLKRLEKLAAIDATLMFFESPNRLTKSLEDMKTVFGPDRPATVARELTKMHEEMARGSLGDLAVHFGEQSVKGEIVILVGPPVEETLTDVDALLGELLERMSVSKAASEAATLTGQSKRELYQRALALSAKD